MMSIIRMMDINNLANLLISQFRIMDVNNSSLQIISLNTTAAPVNYGHHLFELRISVIQIDLLISRIRIMDIHNLN